MINCEEKTYTPFDPCAPRYREKVHDILFIKSTWNNRDCSGGCQVNGEHYWLKQGGEWFIKLKENYPQLKRYKDKDIKNYIKEFNKTIVDSIIDHRDGVILPMKTGTMLIATLGKRKKAVDFKRSNEEERFVYFRNDHSEHYGGGVYWTAEWSTEYARYIKNAFPNHNMWYFTPNQAFMDKIGKVYKTDWKRYWVLTNTRRIDDICYSYKKLNRAKYLSKIILKNYNEFDFD